MFHVEFVTYSRCPIILVYETWIPCMWMSTKVKSNKATFDIN